MEMMFPEFFNCSAEEIRERIQVFIPMLRPDLYGDKYEWCLKNYIDALDEDGCHYPELRGEYAERLLEVIPAEVDPKQRADMLLIVARSLLAMIHPDARAAVQRIKKADQYAREARGLFNRDDRPKVWTEANILMGAAQLLCAKPGDGESAKVPSTLARLVIRGINPGDSYTRYLWAKALLLLAATFVWNQNWSADPEGTNADLAIKAFEDAAHMFNKMEYMDEAEAALVSVKRIKHSSAYRTREVRRAIGTLFCLEMAHFSHQRDGNPPTRAARDLYLCRGSVCSDSTDHHAQILLHLRQRALNAFLRASKALRRNSKPWTAAIRGAALAMLQEGSEGNENKLGTLVPGIEHLCSDDDDDDFDSDDDFESDEDTDNDDLDSDDDSESDRESESDDEHRSNGDPESNDDPDNLESDDSYGSVDQAIDEFWSKM